MNTVKLFAPESYWELTSDQRRSLTNGCGPGRFAGILIPDTFYGLRISAACDIHDYMYAIGATDQDKIDADIVFLNNMLRLIKAGTSSKLLFWLRRRKALIYYQAVSLCGGPFYWNSKNKKSEFKMVER